MAGLGTSGFFQFDRLVAVVRRTRELLDAVAADGELPSGGADFLADATLPHLEGIQDGFRGWLRADAAGTAELRYLVGQQGSIRAAGRRVDAETARAEAAAEAAAGPPASAGQPPAPPGCLAPRRPRPCPARARVPAPAAR